MIQNEFQNEAKINHETMVIKVMVQTVKKQKKERRHTIIKDKGLYLFVEIILRVT